jgi:UDP-N-acetylmuramate dehydrogenase
MKPLSVSLKEYSSLHVGGDGNLIVITSESELVKALHYASTHDLRVHILGDGTNTYFGDTIENLLVLKVDIKGIECTPLQPTTYNLVAAAGETWDDVVQYAIDHDLWGIENLSYVPGTAGAAPIQNIGAYGAELKDVFVSLRAYDRTQQTFVELLRDDCQFGYRDSMFKQTPGRYVITRITLTLSKTPIPVLTYKPLDTLAGKEHITLGDVRNLVIATRQTKLPDWKEYPNVGSFFKNPIVTQSKGETLRESYPDIALHAVDAGYKVSAAWLIEHVAHMKGFRTGNVGTWPSQPLVIVNYGDATAEDINRLATDVQAKVAQATGIQLEREVNFIE